MPHRAATDAVFARPVFGTRKGPSALSGAIQAGKTKRGRPLPGSPSVSPIMSDRSSAMIIAGRLAPGIKSPLKI